MTQLALPIDWQRRGEGERLLLCDANADAVALLRDWQRWPGPAALLVGPRKSARSILGRLFAAESGGEVIDDADSESEERLFHAWNEAQNTGRPVLLIAEHAPPVWSPALPDLRTRLATAAIARIQPPDEALIVDLVAHDLGRLGAAFAPDVPGYVARRIERCYDAADAIVVALNAAALSRNCKISVALAGELLGD